jgi:hypothetical protein
MPRCHDLAIWTIPQRRQTNAIERSTIGIGNASVRDLWRILSRIPTTWKLLALTGHVYVLCPIRVLLFMHGA